jgi:N-acetylglucosamine-6-phosphate deacetylase
MDNTGLVDLQVNGYAGVDFNTADLEADALDHALHAMLSDGVTCCLPTLITAREDELAARLAALDRAVARSRLGPLMVPGYHLEGPFLNPAEGYAGCHPRSAMVDPDPALVARLLTGLARPVMLLTLAPERPAAETLVRWARDRNILLAMGHTAADAATVERAAGWGVALSTHLGNALPQPQPKFLNPLMAQLTEDRLSASFIADGIHIPPAALKVLLRAKGLGRSVLVTDGTAASAAPAGLYDFAGMRIEHAADGSVRVPGSSILAGSALRLDQAVHNIAAWGLASPDEAMDLASGNPTALLRRVGLVRPHAKVVWSDGLRPVQIFLDEMTIQGSTKTFP